MASKLITRAKDEIDLDRDNLYIAVGCSFVLSALVVAFFL